MVLWLALCLFVSVAGWLNFREFKWEQSALINANAVFTQKPLGRLAALFYFAYSLPLTSRSKSLHFVPLDPLTLRSSGPFNSALGTIKAIQYLTVHFWSAFLVFVAVQVFRFHQSKRKLHLAVLFLASAKTGWFFWFVSLCWAASCKKH